MGGTISATSQPNDGSTFKFTVKLGVSDGTAQPQLEPDLLTGMRVLVVDDNPINRMIFRKQLEAWGMVVETSDSAVSASARMLAPASDAPIEILLLDEMMPDVSGSDFAQQLRLNERWADLPIILATSAGEFLSTEASQRLFTRRLTKPVRQSSLFDTLIGVATERLPARD